jgi:hypothetical protein
MLVCNFFPPRIAAEQLLLAAWPARRGPPKGDGSQRQRKHRQDRNRTRPSKDKAQKLRQLFADAPQYARKALENSLGELTSFGSKPRAPVESAGRTGSRHDGEWDPYIDDFATKITDQMDVIFSACEGWPGIRSPKVKDWIAKYQITAEGWYVAHPDLTVRNIHHVKRVGKAAEEFLDKIG